MTIYCILKSNNLSQKNKFLKIPILNFEDSSAMFYNIKIILNKNIIKHF